MSQGESVDWATAEMPELPGTSKKREPLNMSKLVGIFSTVLSSILLISAGYMFYAWIINYDSSKNLTLPPPDEYLDWQSDFRTVTGLDGMSATGAGVAICVIDTGIDLSHQDFGGRQLTGWKDFIQDQPDPYDDQGHGTAMAGLIWADGWLKGVSPGADLYVAKAMSSSGEGVDETIAEAVDWCVSSDVDIISMSLGGAAGFNFFFTSTDALENSVNDALSQGIFVIAAAGNDGEDDDGDVASPGSIEDVICVGGIDRTGVIWSGSSEGDNNGRLFPLPPIMPRNNPNMKPEVTAPGKDVPVLLRPSEHTKEPTLSGPYAHASGTSAATAWVAGGLALLLQEKPELQHDGSSGGQSAISDVKQWLADSATGQDGHDDHMGYGVFNAQAFITAANS
jgi:serine protease AprX